MIELSLWGPRALEFDGDTVYEVGQNNHVIAIFVGTSMKQYKGSPPFLSGTSACRWYINENDVTEIRDFYKRYYTNQKTFNINFVYMNLMTVNSSKLLQFTNPSTTD
jgi:hypothetical protein